MNYTLTLPINYFLHALHFIVIGGSKTTNKMCVIQVHGFCFTNFPDVGYVQIKKQQNV